MTVKASETEPKSDGKVSAATDGGSDSLKVEVLEDLTRVESAVDHSRAQVHGFMQRIFGLTNLNTSVAHAMLTKMVKEARVTFERGPSVPSSGRKIPKIIHRIWLTNPDAPVEPPSQHINKLIHDAERFAGQDWQHWLWVQSEDLLPDAIERLRRETKFITIQKIEASLFRGEPWEKLFNSFLNDHKYPFASDILRMKILLEYGGIYADLGARFKREAAASAIIDNFNYAFIFWDTMFFQNSLMAMEPGAFVAKAFMRIANNPYSLPPSLFTSLDGTEEGMAFSGLLITAIILASDPRNFKICPLAPNSNLIEWVSEQSWYTQQDNGSGKFGNAFVPSTGASFLQKGLLGSAIPDEIFTA